MSNRRPGYVICTMHWSTFIFLCFPLLASAQTDSLLQAHTWRQSNGDLLRLTVDGTFEFDYGERARTRYLMGRYTLSEDDEEITLGVDYLLGKRRIHPRYRRDRDFYLTYAIDSLSQQRLVLIDVLTDEMLTFEALPQDEREDPAERRILKPTTPELKLPGGWGS